MSKTAKTTTGVAEATKTTGGEIAPAPTETGIAEHEAAETEDSLTFGSGVIEKLIALSLRDIPEIAEMSGGLFARLQDALGMPDMRKGIIVEITPEGGILATLSIVMEYGTYAPDLFGVVKKAVVDAMARTTGLEVAGVHLHVEDMLSPEESAELRAKAESLGDGTE